MKKSTQKLVPDSLPSLFKTIKRSYSPDAASGYQINLDDMKTKKICIKDETTIIPPLNFKRKVSIGDNEVPKGINLRGADNIRQSETQCITERPKSYRLRKTEASTVAVRKNPSMIQRESPLKENRNNSNLCINLKHIRQVTDKKASTDKKSRRYPQCRIIKSKQIPFDLVFDRPAKKKESIL